MESYSKYDHNWPLDKFTVQSAERKVSSELADVLSLTLA